MPRVSAPEILRLRRESTISNASVSELHLALHALKRDRNELDNDLQALKLHEASARFTRR